MGCASSSPTAGQPGGQAPGQPNGADGDAPAAHAAPTKRAPSHRVSCRSFRSAPARPARVLRPHASPIIHSTLTHTTTWRQGAGSSLYRTSPTQHPPPASQLSLDTTKDPVPLAARSRKSLPAADAPPSATTAPAADSGGGGNGAGGAPGDGGGGLLSPTFASMTAPAQAIMRGEMDTMMVPHENRLYGLRLATEQPKKKGGSRRGVATRSKRLSNDSQPDSMPGSARSTSGKGRITSSNKVPGRRRSNEGSAALHGAAHSAAAGGPAFVATLREGDSDEEEADDDLTAAAAAAAQPADGADAPPAGRQSGAGKPKFGKRKPGAAIDSDSDSSSSSSSGGPPPPPHKSKFQPKFQHNVRAPVYGEVKTDSSDEGDHAVAGGAGAVPQSAVNPAGGKHSAREGSDSGRSDGGSGSGAPSRAKGHRASPVASITDDSDEGKGDEDSDGDSDGDSEEGSSEGAAVDDWLEAEDRAALDEFGDAKLLQDRDINSKFERVDAARGLRVAGHKDKDKKHRNRRASAGKGNAADLLHSDSDGKSGSDSDDEDDDNGEWAERGGGRLRVVETAARNCTLARPPPPTLGCTTGRGGRLPERV